MARVSLCLIARDEEALLGACLSSVRDAVDEMIVVDTGSTDQTAAIARHHGATVVEQAWADDFAAARNAALDAATGEWVLLLDADERLVRPQAIRDAVATDAFDCGLLALHSASRADASPDQVVAGAARRGEPVLLPRLFRRTPDLRWEGVIHEHVEAWLRAPGRRVARVDAPIAHYGGLGEVVGWLGKVARNIRLLHRRIGQNPHDGAAYVYLADELRKIGQPGAALEAADRAWDLLLVEGDVRADGGRVSSLVLVATQRALLQVMAQDYAGAQQTISVAMERRRQGRVHPNLHYLAGLAIENLSTRAAPAERRALLYEAAEAYIAAAGCEGEQYTEPVLPGASSWAAATRLGTVLLQVGRPDLALEAFEVVVELQPDGIEPALGRAEALVDLGRPEEALGALAPLLDRAGADGWLLAAAAADALGAVSDRAVFLTRAHDTARETLVGLHRLERLNQMLAA